MAEQKILETKKLLSYILHDVTPTLCWKDSLMALAPRRRNDCTFICWNDKPFLASMGVLPSVAIWTCWYFHGSSIARLSLIPSVEARLINWDRRHQHSNTNDPRVGPKTHQANKTLSI